jgi:hypothetical protein
MDYIENRKANFKEMKREYTQYFTVDERERAFMDALRVII